MEGCCMFYLISAFLIVKCIKCVFHCRYPHISTVIFARLLFLWRKWFSELRKCQKHCLPEKRQNTTVVVFIIVCATQVKMSVEELHLLHKLWNTLLASSSNTLQWASDTQSRTSPYNEHMWYFYILFSYVPPKHHMWDRHARRDIQWPLSQTQRWSQGSLSVLLVPCLSSHRFHIGPIVEKDPSTHPNTASRSHNAPHR